MAVALPSTSTNSMSIVFNQAYYPYGDEVYSQTFDPEFKFAGYEWDSKTLLDYAFARYYNARLGRFMSADPASGDLSDPQSENRYAYVQNNPTSMTDPSGLCGGGISFGFGFAGDPWFVRSDILVTAPVAVRDQVVNSPRLGIGRKIELTSTGNHGSETYD